MRHAGTQEIETPRLLLRRLMPSDAPMMYANWAKPGSHPLAALDAAQGLWPRRRSF